MCVVLTFAFVICKHIASWTEGSTVAGVVGYAVGTLPTTCVRIHCENIRTTLLYYPYHGWLIQ